MITIVRSEHEPPIGKKVKAGLSLLGLAAAHDPKPYRKLLGKYAVATSANSNLSLASGLIEGLALQNPSFNRELSRLLSHQVAPESAFNESEDHFVEAIAGAVAGISGAVGEIAGSKARQKMTREAARQEIIGQMLAIKANQQASQAPRPSGNKQLFLIAGAVGLLAVIGLFITWQKKRLINPESI